MTMSALEGAIIGHYIGKYIVNAIIEFFQIVFLAFKLIFLILKCGFYGFWLGTAFTLDRAFNAKM